MREIKAGRSRHVLTSSRGYSKLQAEDRNAAVVVSCKQHGSGSETQQPPTLASTAASTPAKPTWDAVGANTRSKPKVCACTSLLLPPLGPPPAAGWRSSSPRPSRSPAAGYPTTGLPGVASAASLSLAGRTRANTRMLPGGKSGCRGDGSVECEGRQAEAESIAE